MKRTWLLIITVALLLAAGCAPAATTPPDATPAATPTTTPVATPTTTPAPGFTAPSVQELSDGGYAHPEIPRITAEALKDMMDRATAAGAYSKDMGTVVWYDFVLIDVQPECDVDAEGHKRFSRSFLLGSTNVPFSYYWVTDPERELPPEELSAYRAEQDKIALTIAKLDRDKPIILYDATTTDAEACALALRLIEAGFDPGQVSVMWQGFNHWVNDLHYPFAQISWHMPA